MFHVFQLLPHLYSWDSILGGLCFPAQCFMMGRVYIPGSISLIGAFGTSLIHRGTSSGRWAAGIRRLNWEQGDVSSRTNQPWESQFTTFLKGDVWTRASSRHLPTFWLALVCLLTVSLALHHSLRWARVGWKSSATSSASGFFKDSWHLGPFSEIRCPEGKKKVALHTWKNLVIS